MSHFKFAPVLLVGALLHAVPATAQTVDDCLGHPTAQNLKGSER